MVPPGVPDGPLFVLVHFLGLVCTVISLLFAEHENGAKEEMINLQWLLEALLLGMVFKWKEKITSTMVMGIVQGTTDTIYRSKSRRANEMRGDNRNVVRMLNRQPTDIRDEERMDVNIADAISTPKPQRFDV